MLKASRLVIVALTCSVIGSVPHTVLAKWTTNNVENRTVERAVHINRPGPGDSRYAYVPFDVPPGATRISISYRYERNNGANTIDIGVFDARSSGSVPGPRGFRGWSGGRRSEFFISRDKATPGYLPGFIPAGKWHIILGLYQIAPAGVDVALRIQIETRGKGLVTDITDSANELPGAATAQNTGSHMSSRRSASTQDVRWWIGDLHTHTVHSDGDWTIAGLISSAHDSGLDFIVITDHNTASHHAEIDRLSKASRQPLVIRGEEITTYGGHTNAWGLPSGTWIDFRSRPGDTSRISAIAAQAHRAGALISINHPFALCGGCAWSYDQAARDFDAIEVWNGEWDATDEPALKMWDKILQSGRRITAIGSSDSHRSNNPIGHPATHAGTRELSQTSLLRAIRQGRVYLTSEPQRPIVTFEAITNKRPSRFGIGEQLRVSGPTKISLLIKVGSAPSDATISVISNGQMVRSLSVGKDNDPQVIEIDCQTDAYFRLEVRDKANAMLALTNPIYITVE